MKIISKLVELEVSEDGNSLTIRLPTTKAQITLTQEEAHQLWIALSQVEDAS